MDKIREPKKCENCKAGFMKPFGEDSFYIYHKCTRKGCAKERLELKTDVVLDEPDGIDKKRRQ